MKDEYMFLSIIVPSPRNPKEKLDVFLQPLITELKHLWEVGVQTYDVSNKQNFQMRAALIMTPQNPRVPLTTVNLRKPVCLIS